MSNVPHRFKESQFKKYAPYIADVLNHWPEIVRFKPLNISMETFSGRLRDAITAGIKFGYTYPSVDSDLLRQHGPNISCSMETDAIAVGPRDAIRQKNLLAEHVPNQAKRTSEYEVQPEALAVLCSIVSKIKPVPPFFVRDPNADYLVELETTYDVAFVEDASDKGKFFLI